MAWGRLPAELAELADQLRNEPSTERTADFIYTYRGKYESDWRTSKVIKSEADGAPIPPPRNQAFILQDVTSLRHISNLSFIWGT
jgi:hypothetical protein